MKQSNMKKLMLFATVFAFCMTLFAKPLDAKAATAPTNVRQTGYSATEIAFAWDEVLGATSYECSYSTNTTADGTMFKTNTNAAKISGLTAGTTYYVKVRAYEGTSAGTWSGVIGMDTEPNNLTTLQQTAIDTNSFTISWDLVPGATGYYVSYGSTNDVNASTEYGYVTTNSATFSNLPANTAYFVFVIPYRNAALNSNYCQATGKYTAGVTIPTTPKNLGILTRSYLGSAEYSIPSKCTVFEWEPTSSLANTDGYEIEIRNLKNKKIKTVTSESYYGFTNMVTNGKLFNTAFKYRVRSYIVFNGQKYYSPYTKYNTYVPGAVLQSISRDRVTSTGGKLKWKKVSGAKSYTVYWKTSKNGKWKVAKKNVKGTSAYVSFKPFTVNYYYVKANKIKIGKKNYSSSNMSKLLDVYSVTPKN